MCLRIRRLFWKFWKPLKHPRGRVLLGLPILSMLQLRNHVKVIEGMKEEVGTWKSIEYTFG